MVVDLAHGLLGSAEVLLEPARQGAGGLAVLSQLLHERPRDLSRQLRLRRVGVVAKPYGSLRALGQGLEVDRRFRHAAAPVEDGLFGRAAALLERRERRSGARDRLARIVGGGGD